MPRNVLSCQEKAGLSRMIQCDKDVVELVTIEKSGIPQLK